MVEQKKKYTKKNELLAAVFRMSFDSKANVIPIFKQGDKMLLSNYRPFSLTSIVRKLMESITAKKIREHQDKHNLINHT